MEHNTDRILWTVLVLAIGVALFVIFKPAANGLLQQGVEKIQTVATNVNSNTSDSSNSHTAIGTNLIKGTSSDLQTAPDSSDKYSNGHLHIFSSDELSGLAGKQITAKVFIHNTTNHTVNLVIWTPESGFGVGTNVPAGTDGYSTITDYNVASNVSKGDINIRAYGDNAAISGVQYKELKLENGNVATPWVP